MSFVATNWLPNQATGENYGTVSKVVPCSQIMSEVVDFINKRSEKVTESCSKITGSPLLIRRSV